MTEKLHRAPPPRGPSARFPTLSSLLPREALWLVSEVVTYWTNRVLPPVSPSLPSSQHVVRHYDLRAGEEFWECRHCGAEVQVRVPGTLDHQWRPHATRGELSNYGQRAATFIEAHAPCKAKAQLS